MAKKRAGGAKPAPKSAAKPAAKSAPKSALRYILHMLIVEARYYLGIADELLSGA